MFFNLPKRTLLERHYRNCAGGTCRKCDNTLDWDAFSDESKLLDYTFYLTPSHCRTLGGGQKMHELKLLILQGSTSWSSWVGTTTTTASKISRIQVHDGTPCHGFLIQAKTSLLPREVPKLRQDQKVLTNRRRM